MKIGDILRYSGGRKAPHWYEVTKLPARAGWAGNARLIATGEGTVTDPDESNRRATGFSRKHPEGYENTRTDFTNEEGWRDITYFLLTGTLRE